MRTRRWCQLIFVALYGVVYWLNWRAADHVTNPDGLQYLWLMFQTLPGLPIGLLLRDRVHLFGTPGTLNAAAAFTAALVLAVIEILATGSAQSNKACSGADGKEGGAQLL